MNRLSVAQLNMPRTMESCVEQLRIICYAHHCAFDSDDTDYQDLLSEIKDCLWKQYKDLGGEAQQIGDLVPWGRKRSLQKIVESDRTWQNH